MPKDSSESQYLKDRKEQANREADTANTSTIPHVEAHITGTVTNPGEKAPSSGDVDAGEASGASSDTGEGSAGSGLPAGSSSTFAGQTTTESATTGSQRTTRETGDHVRK